MTSAEVKPIAANAPIEDLNLTVGAYNSLRHLGVKTVADLAWRTRAQLLATAPNMSEKKLDEIEFILKRNGRWLAG